MRKTYPADLTDAEWNRLKSCFTRSKLRRRPRVHGLREIFNAIFYVVRSGCAWRLLPSDFAPWQTVYYHFRRLRLDGLWHLILKALRKTTRPTGREASRALGGHYGCPEHQDNRGIGQVQWLRRPQESQGP